MKKLLVLALPVLLSGCSYYDTFYHSVVDKMNTDTLHYVCGDTSLDVQQNNARQEVSFVYKEKLLHLKQGISASGVRYTDGIYVFWSKGDTATLYHHDSVVLGDCQLQKS